MSATNTQSLNVLTGNYKGKDMVNKINKHNLKDLIAKEVLLHQSKAQLPSKDTTDDILNELIESIGEIEFKLLAFPEIAIISKEIQDLKPLVFNPDGSYNTENEKEAKEYGKLQNKLDKCKLSKNHYLILCIEQLLKIAVANEWGLCKKNGYVYLYNGCYWKELEKERFQFFLGNVALKMGVEKFKGKIHTFKEDLFKQFMADAYLPTPVINKNKVLINLQNGTFEISPDVIKLRAFDRSDFITHQLPFEYDPEATAPLFIKYLNEVLPDIEKQNLLSEYCGYIFTKTSVLKLEKVLILYGSGANGKSVFFDIINALLGIENVGNFSLSSLTNENGYHRAKIANKLVNYASEINGKLETDTFKQMASGEPIEARLPYGEPFILADYAKLVFNCNQLPSDVEHTNAFFRRFMILGFDVTIPEDTQDKELSNKIINNELSGVFNWVLLGLSRLLKQKKFSKCAAVDNARSDYEKQSDSVKMFLDEHKYKVSKDYTPIKIMYEQYRAFCLDDGFRPVSKSNFMKRLTHHKIYVKRIDQGNVAYVEITENGII